MTLSDDQTTPRLVVTGDPDNSGAAREFVFEFPSGVDTAPLEVSEGIRTQRLSQTSGINAILGELVGDGDSQNQTIAVDLGTSQFAVSISFIAKAGGGEQWGDGSGTLPADATGAEPIEKMQTLSWTLNNTQIDSLPEELAGEITGSFGPARYEFGMRTSDGPLDPLDVIVESPSVGFSSNASTRVSGEVTAILTADLAETFDSKGRSKRGTS